MSAENECSLAVKYRTVRKHLDALGYKQILPLDALSLVENLLADLIQTTESLKHFKSIAQDNIESCSQLQLAVDPYKCDNARLVQENNKLNFELMREKDSHQKDLNDLKKRLRRTESEHADLQLSSSRNLERIKNLEAESANKSKKLLELQGKCCKPVVNNASLASKKRTCYPLRRPLLECDILPRTKSSLGSLQIARQVEPHVVDFVAMGDHQMNCLNYEVTKLKEELTFQADNINTLEIQLALEEKETCRLRKMLEGGRPYSAVAKECSCKKSEKIHSSLDCCQIENSEANILLQAKYDLEQQLKDALNKQHEAMSQALKLAERNEELEKELRVIDHIALAVEADCNTAVKENNRRVCRLQEKLNDVLTQVHALENELLEEKRKAHELKIDLDANRLEKLDIQHKLEFTLEEKKKLTDRINQLTVIATKNKNISSLHSKHHITEKIKENTFNQDEEIIIDNNREISNDVQKILYEKETTIVSLQNKLISLEAERDYYRQEFTKSRNHQDKDSRNEKVLTERLEHERNLAKADVERLIEERDALRERLKMATEAHTSEQRRLRETLHDVEKRLKHVDCERYELLTAQGTRQGTVNGLQDQLEDLREELKRTKQELSEQRTQYFQLRALQDQTDQALGDVQGQLSQSESEMAKAIDRNKNMEQQQTQLDIQVKDLKQEINTLHASMAQIDHEKDQLLMVLDEKTEKIAALERELQFKEQQVLSAEQQLRDLQHRNQLCVDQSADKERQVRSIQMEMDNLQRQITSSSIDRENAIQENRRLQDDLAAVTCEVRNLQRELDVSRAESFDLKRQLQTYVSEVRRAEELLNKKENERTDMLNHFRSLSLEATVLENSNHSLETEAAEARGALQSARDRLLDFERQTVDKDCLIKGYETQIVNLTQTVATLETDLRQQEEQKLRAESDLNAVRDLCVKLDEQKDNIVQQLGEKDSLVSQFESQLSRLRTENSVVQDQMSRDHAAIERLEELLDQARQESMNTQTSNQELQNVVSRLKQKISDLQDKLSSESSELRRYQNQAAEYSKQVSELRRQVTNERFDRARKEEENRSVEKHSSCCNCRFRRSNHLSPSNPLNNPNSPTISAEINPTSLNRSFDSSESWAELKNRCSQQMPKENTNTHEIPTWKVNRFDLKNSSCRCTFCSKLSEGHSSSSSGKSVQIPVGTKQDIQVEIVNIIPENMIHSFEGELGDLIVKKKEVHKRELKETNISDTESKEKILRDKDFMANDLNSMKLKEKESKDEEHKSLLSSTKVKNGLTERNNVLLKNSSVQTSLESTNCCDSLKETILQMFQSLEEQSIIRQATPVGLSPVLEKKIISKPRIGGTDMYNRTFPNLESTDIQSVNTSRNAILEKTTSGYSTGSQKTWLSSPNFAQHLKERNNCVCCGSDSTFQSSENSKNCKDDRKFINSQESKPNEKKKSFLAKKKSDEFGNFDVTNFEFTEVLLEIEKSTRSLERYLALMNETIKQNRKNLIESDGNAWNPETENVQPIGTSTPKSQKNNEQIWHSIPNYTGSDIANFNPHEEESSSEEEFLNNEIQTDVQEFDEKNQRNGSVSSTQEKKSNFGKNSKNETHFNDSESSKINIKPSSSSELDGTHYKGLP